MNNKYILLLMLVTGTFLSGYSGNPDRSGGAGATQLLLNPFGRSAGTLGANASFLKGAEAMHFNVGGLGFVGGYEIMVSTVSYLQGTGISLNNASLAIPMGEAGENVIGISATAMSFGDIAIRTEGQPDGTLGTYTPQFYNMGFAFSRKFSNSISAGILVRYVTEGLTNVTASGICFDMGVQYQTALNPKNKIKKEDFRFGMSLRNLGTDISYSGSGLSAKTIISNSLTSSVDATRTTYFGAERYNLPSLVNIGVSYDIRLDKKGSETYYHRLTPCGNFNYNAFSENNLSVGAEYSFREMFMVRGGFYYQELFKAISPSSTDVHPVYDGFAAGCTIQMPVTKNGLNMGIDYSYAPTRIFSGIHNVTLKMNIGYKKS